MKNWYIVLFLLFSCLIQAQNKYKVYFKLSESDKDLNRRFTVTANDNKGNELQPINATYNGYEIIYFENQNVNSEILYLITVKNGVNDYVNYLSKFTLHKIHQKSNKNEPLNEFFEIDGYNVNKIGGSIFLNGISLMCIDLQDIDKEKTID